MDENAVQNASEQNTTETMETHQESMGAEMPETATQDGGNATMRTPPAPRQVCRSKPSARICPAR